MLQFYEFFFTDIKQNPWSGLSESLAAERLSRTNEDPAAREARLQGVLKDEEEALRNELMGNDPEKIARMDVRDIPAGTITTQPYFSDFPVGVALK